MGRPSILLVDDEPLNRAALCAVLGDTYVLHQAGSGREALATARAHNPALVLLDIGLPDLDGYEVCRCLRAADAGESLQVIFITGYGGPHNEAAGFSAGAVDYITKPISPPLVRARVAAHLSLVRAAALERSWRDAILMLGQAGHYNDTDTGSHVWRMAAFAAALAHQCGWDSDACAQLELAAPMHDMGKIGIPQSILRKPGPMDAHERAIMCTHPRIGYDILSKGAAPLFQLAAQIALRHHERFDGSGYPDGLAGTAIPEAARIVALADVFDALSVARPYKPAWPLAQVLAHIDAVAGSHFDPAVVAALHAALPRLLELQQRWRDSA